MDRSYVTATLPQSTPKINLQGIVNVSQLDGLLSQILGRLSQQDATISALLSLCATLISEATASKRFADMQEILGQLDKRIAHLQSYATAIIDGKE